MPDFLTAIDWSQVLPFIAIGFAAQVIDGALGMAFGVINSTLLVTVMGVPPAVASASVHAVETFTTAASGVSHVVHRNVDWKLFRRLVIPGMIGAVAGATLLSTIDASVAKPFVMAYLACIGLYLLFRAVGGEIKPRKPRAVAPLGLVGGFLDAAGGGGWGPVVTSNLLIQGATPRHTIGTVNTAEFFLTATASATFFSVLGWSAFTLHTLGILIGGIVAAPFGGILAKRVPTRRPAHGQFIPHLQSDTLALAVEKCQRSRTNRSHRSCGANRSILHCSMIAYIGSTPFNGDDPWPSSAAS